MSEYIELDLSVGNPIFKAVESVPPKNGKKTIYLPNKTLPESLLKPLAFIYKQVSSGEELLLEDVTVAVGFRQLDDMLVINRTYAPCIMRDENGLVLRWSQNYFPISFDAKDKIFTVGGIELELQEQKIGFFDEIVLTGFFTTVTQDDNGLDAETTFILHFPIRPENFEEWKCGKVNLNVLKDLLKKKKLNEFYDKVRSRDADSVSGSGGLGRAETDVRKLEPGNKYTIVQAEARTTSYGPTYVLLLQADSEVGLDKDTTAWSYSSINGLLDAGLELPATYTYTRTMTEDGKPRHKFVFDNPIYKGNKGGLDLSWI